MQLYNRKEGRVKENTYTIYYNPAGPIIVKATFGGISRGNNSCPMLLIAWNPYKEPNPIIYTLLTVES